MNARPGSPFAVPHEHGFVLVGVVMFVLALTILGLSVFSLSSYEAQFLNKTLDQNRAFYAAQGGIERTRFVLSATNLLENAQTNLSPGVISAIARQWQAPDTVSSGPIDWSGEDIIIQVTAQDRGEQKTLWGRYRPQQLDNYYKRLITCSGIIEANTEFNVEPPNTRLNTVHLNGGVWLNPASDSSTWMGKLVWNGPTPIKRNPGVGVPSATSFIAAHIAGATSVSLTPIGSDSLLTLDAGANTLGYFTCPPNNTFYTLRSSVRVQINVTGRAVLLLPHGAFIDGAVTVNRVGSDACLVIVAAPGTEPAYPDRAIHFFGGLINDPAAPAILVSDAEVRLESITNGFPIENASAVSIFAANVFLTGPPIGVGNHFALSYNNAALEPYIDWLTDRGALPNATAATGSDLLLRAGTWTELTP